MMTKKIQSDGKRSSNRVSESFYLKKCIEDYSGYQRKAFWHDLMQNNF
jgi:hypothetical protein